jgi:hypothetical protein
MHGHGLEQMLQVPQKWPALILRANGSRTEPWEEHPFPDRRLGYHNARARGRPAR